MGVTFQMTGFAELVQNLSTLGPRVYNRAVRTGLDKGSRSTVKRSRSLCRKRMTQVRRLNRKGAQMRERTGALEKSMGVRLTENRKRLTASAVIGPRQGFVIAYDRRTGKVLSGKGKTFRANRARFKIVHDPSKIGHLVELGHGGPHPAPAYPFLRPAWDAGKFDMLRSLEREMTVAVDSEGREK
jgi:hypothetical protein